MKNKKFWRVLLAIVMVLGITIIGCDFGGSEEFTVTFDAIGGYIPGKTTSSIEIKVKSGETVTDLPIPQFLDSYFGGWFSQKNGAGVEFTTNTKVVSDLIVYSKWIPHQFNDDTGGIFSLTGIPADFDGKYALISGFNHGKVIFGFNSVTKHTPIYLLNMGQIQNSDLDLSIYNGVLKVPLWNFEFQQLDEDYLHTINYSGYLGNDTFENVIVEIFDFCAFPVSDGSIDLIRPPPLLVINFSSVTFENGNAVLSFYNGKFENGYPNGTFEGTWVSSDCDPQLLEFTGNNWFDRSSGPQGTFTATENQITFLPTQGLVSLIPFTGNYVFLNANTIIISGGTRYDQTWRK